MRVEDEYPDVLQNIEFAIVSVYREHLEMSDRGVKQMLEALINHYESEKNERAPRYFRLSEIELLSMEKARAMCEWRLGRGSPPDDLHESVPTTVQPITVDEILACLKRIRKSVKYWHKKGGKRGYLNYVASFIE